MVDFFTQHQIAGTIIHWGKLIGARHTCVVSGFEKVNDLLYEEFGIKRYVNDPTISTSEIPNLDGEMLNGLEELLILESAILRRDPSFLHDVIDKRKFARIEGTPAISRLTLSYVKGTVNDLRKRLNSTMASMNYTSTLSELSVRMMYCRFGRTFAFVKNAEALPNLPIEKNIGRSLGSRRFLELDDMITLVKGDSYSRVLHKNLSQSSICVVL